MARFNVEALEKFTVRTTYSNFEATDAVDAVEQCRRGAVAYDSHRIEEGTEVWLETVSVSLAEPNDVD